MIEFLLGHEEALLFAGMSLGKTATTLAAVDQLFSNWETRGVLVVAPLRVANVVWPVEVTKWDQFRWMRVVSLRNKEGIDAYHKRDAHVYMINYESLHKLRALLLKKQTPPFDTVVWDEVSMAKDRSGKRVNGVRKLLRKHCVRHWGLTGTPTPNSLMDLFAQARLVDSGRCLGPSFTHFRDNFFYPVDYNQYKWLPRDGAEEEIYKRVAPITLVMKTEDHLDLPQTHTVDHVIPLPKGAKETYKTLEKEFLVELSSGAEVKAVNSAVMVTKLLQITSGAVYHEGGYEELHTAKVDKCKSVLKNTGNTLLVYMYIHELERLKRAFPDAVLFMDAKGEKEQKALCDRWNRGEIKTLLVHPQSMSHGLNLQGGGSDVVWVSPPYSRERYDQLNARLARRGQKEQTHIHRILVEDSIDFAVTEVLRSKGERQDNLLNALKAMNKL